MGGAGHGGTFSPLLSAYKTKTEKLSSIHAAWTARLAELVKEVSMYGDRLQKTHKKVKEDESATLEAVKLIQDTTALLQKSKEVRERENGALLNECISMSVVRDDIFSAHCR